MSWLKKCRVKAAPHSISDHLSSWEGQRNMCHPHITPVNGLCCFLTMFAQSLTWWELSELSLVFWKSLHHINLVEISTEFQKYLSWTPGDKGQIILPIRNMAGGVLMSSWYFTRKICNIMKDKITCTFSSFLYGDSYELVKNMKVILKIVARYSHLLWIVW